MSVRRLPIAMPLILLASFALSGSAEAEEANAPAAQAADAIRLNFKDAPLDAVLQHLSEVAGISVVTDAPTEGRITLISKQPISLDGALALLDSALKDKGYATVRMGQTLKIVPLTEAKKASIPVHSGSEPEQITPSDQLITQVIPLQSVDAVKLKDSLKALVPDYADLSADASSNALILTDTAANVRRIVQIVSALDASKATVSEVKVFALKYADATSAAKLINDVFDVEKAATSSQSRSRSPFMMFRSGFGRGDRPDASSQSDQEQFQPQRTIAAADDRTNTVVVSGPSATLAVVEGVIQELDSNPADAEDVLIYHLKNADATNLATVLKTLFEEESSTAARRTSGGAGSSSRGGRSGFFGSRTALSAGATESLSDLAGQVRVVANADTNSLLLMAAPKHFEKLRLILTELDRPVPQVLIKVLIAEVTHSDDVDLGVELSALNMRAGGATIEALTNFGLSGETEGFIMRSRASDFSATIRMLQEVGKLDILSRPYVLASDNKEATITVGNEVPFITNTRTTETGQTINTIQYQDIGIILKVTPHINTDGLVIMDVVPEISSLTGQTVPISETVDAEVFAKRSASSRVAILDGETIVIGGLMEDRKTDSVSKIPILGSIPYLGALFRRTVTDTSKTELLIFLTPHVATGAEALAGISRREEQSAKIAPTAVKPGAFAEHMKAMRAAGDTKDKKAAESQTPKK